MRLRRTDETTVDALVKFITRGWIPLGTHHVRRSDRYTPITFDL